MDVAFDVRRRLQGYRRSANDTGDRTAHDHPHSGNSAGHLAPLTDDDLGAADVTLNLTINLQRSLADDLETLADDLEIVADQWRPHLGVGAVAVAERCGCHEQVRTASTNSCQVALDSLSTELVRKSTIVRPPDCAALSCGWRVSRWLTLACASASMTRMLLP